MKRFREEIVVFIMWVNENIVKIQQIYVVNELVYYQC